MWVTPVIFTPASHADKPSLMQYSAANVTTTGNVCFPFCLSVKRTKSSVLSACHQISKCPILCRKGFWGSKFQPLPNDKAHPSPLRCTDNRYLKASSHILFFLVQAFFQVALHTLIKYFTWQSAEIKQGFMYVRWAISEGWTYYTVMHLTLSTVTSY